jgi:hypothetical protein
MHIPPSASNVTPEILVDQLHWLKGVYAIVDLVFFDRELCPGEFRLSVWFGLAAHQARGEIDVFIVPRNSPGDQSRVSLFGFAENPVVDRPPACTRQHQYEGDGADATNDARGAP